MEKATGWPTATTPTPKKKINWQHIWERIKEIIIGLLTADSIRNL